MSASSRAPSAPSEEPFYEWIINFAIQLGRVLCELDDAKASERDAALRAAGPPSATELVPVQAGVMRADDPVAGRLGVQAVLAIDGRQGRLDDLTGGGFTLLARRGDPFASLLAEQQKFLADLCTRVVSLDTAIDLDGRPTAFLDERGVHAVLMRPDFYVFGSAAAPDDLPAPVDDLRAQISTPEGAVR